MSTQRYAIVRDGIVENVVLWDGDAEKWAPPKGAAAYAAPDDAVSRGWTYADGAFVPPPAPVPSFAQIAAAKGRAIADAYAAAIARGAPHRNKRIQIDPESRGNVGDMAQVARLVIAGEAAWPEELEAKGWRTLDNTHLPVTPEQMVAMSLGVANHFVAIRFRASKLKDDLAAAVRAQDADALAAIDPSAGWP